MTQETTNFYLYWQRLRKSVLDLQLLGMAKFLVKIVVLFVLFCWEKQQERYCFLRTANSKPKAFFFFACQTSLDPVKNPHSHVNAYKNFFPLLFNHFIVLLFCFFLLHCWAKEGLLQNVPGAVLSALKDRKSLLCWLLVIKFYKGLGSELQNNVSHPLIWKYFQKLWIECCCKKRFPLFILEPILRFTVIWGNKHTNTTLSQSTVCHHKTLVG